MADSFLEIAAGITAISVIIASIWLAKIVDQLEAIRKLLGSMAARSLDVAKFNDRMHRIATGSDQSVKYLKSIEERLEPFTHSRFERLILDLAKATGIDGDAKDKSGE